jgi:thioredoxin reductase (NADPH)
MSDRPQNNGPASESHDGPPPGVESVVVIGSGPAAWTAAIYAARASLRPLVFPGRSSKDTGSTGGQLMGTTDVENYPGFPTGVTGPELMQHLFDQAMRFGTRVVTDHDVVEGKVEYGLFRPDFQSVKEIDLSRRPFRLVGDGGCEVLTETVIIATGAKANWLGLPNEKRLAESGGGVSACAVCDGALPIFRAQELAVVGGGDSAIEEASYLTKFASKVYLIHRRDELRASKIMQDRALNNPKIEILWNTVVTDVLGGDKITGVMLRNVVTNQERELPLRGLFMGIGHTPVTGFLKGQLETDDKGYIVLKDPYRTTTSVEGVFAAGDVADSVYRQAITAAGMGCKAAIDAERFLAECGESVASDEGMSPEAHWEAGNVGVK